MLLTESKQAYPGQYVEYRIVSHDCTMENLIIRNLRTDTEFSRTELSPYEDGSYADAVCIWQEGEYEIYATGTMTDGEILETEHIPLTIAYDGTLNAPAITAPNLVMKSEGSFTFSFPAVENAQSYHYSFRYGINNSTDYMNGPCYPDQENIITVQEDWTAHVNCRFMRNDPGGDPHGATGRFSSPTHWTRTSTSPSAERKKTLSVSCTAVRRSGLLPAPQERKQSACAGATEAVKLPSGKR